MPIIFVCCCVPSISYHCRDNAVLLGKMCVIVESFALASIKLQRPRGKTVNFIFTMK